MSEEQDAAVKRFNEERNKMLLSLDIDRCAYFFSLARPGVPCPSREVLEVMMHKARTAVVSLPMEARIYSKRWLTQRGMRSDDDGDLG